MERLVHQEYQSWGKKILHAMAEGLDFERYGISHRHPKSVDVQFYDAGNLARNAVDKATQFVHANHGKNTPILYVSLDDMIQGKPGEQWRDVGFSRLFSPDGREQLGYVARPGKKPIEEQIAAVGEQLMAMRKRSDEAPVMVMVEDNVRNAKTMNWVIDRMKEQAIFDHGKLAGVATCFYMATQAEREKMPTPIVESIDYGSAKVDVWTPRDMLFDGFVVEIDNRLGRLPGIFMDTESMEEKFKICPTKSRAFLDRVQDANHAFCHNLEEILRVPVPIDWFAGAEPIAHVTNTQPQQPMRHLMRGAPALAYAAA